MPIEKLQPAGDACPVCDGNKFETWRLGLLQCNSCRLVISPAIWQTESNEKLEEEWFGEDYQPETSFWVKLFESTNNRQTLARLVRARPPGRRLLEIGIGSGSFLNAAREQGFDVMGCDLSDSICRRARKKFGVAVHNGPLTTLAKESRFDVIVMNHLLEHVQQPVNFLGDVRRLLKPGGVVHIAVPNIDCWEASLAGWTSFEPYHLTYFSPATLKQTVSRGGLSIAAISTRDSFSGWFLAFLRTGLGVNRSNGAVTRTAKTVAGTVVGRRSGFVEHGYRIATVITGFLLWPVRFVQSKLGRGDEVICIARKVAAEPNRQGLM